MAIAKLTNDELKKIIEGVSLNTILEKARNVDFDRDIDESGANGLWDFSYELLGNEDDEENAEALYNELWEKVEANSEKKFEDIATKGLSKERATELLEVTKKQIDFNNRLNKIARNFMKENNITGFNGWQDSPTKEMVVLMKQTLDGEEWMPKELKSEYLRETGAIFGGAWSIAQNRDLLKDVKDLEGHLALLGTAETKPEGGDDEKVAGLRIERDIENTRLNLFFEIKPEIEVREKLKSNGFKWSPYLNAWTRQLTPNAEYSLKRVLNFLQEDGGKIEDEQITPNYEVSLWPGKGYWTSSVKVYAESIEEALALAAYKLGFFIDMESISGLGQDRFELYDYNERYMYVDEYITELDKHLTGFVLIENAKAEKLDNKATDAKPTNWNNLTKKELVRLRNEITLNSDDLRDYQNYFGIPEEEVYNFFTGYLDDLDVSAKEEGKPLSFDELIDLANDPEILWRYYRSVENPFGDPNKIEDGINEDPYEADVYKGKEWGVYAKRSQSWVYFGTEKQMKAKAEQLNKSARESGDKHNPASNRWDDAKKQIDAKINKAMDAKPMIMTKETKEELKVINAFWKTLKGYTDKFYSIDDLYDRKNIKTVSDIYDGIIKLEKEIKKSEFTTADGKENKEELLSHFPWIKEDIQKNSVYKNAKKVGDHVGYDDPELQLLQKERIWINNETTRLNQCLEKLYFINSTWTDKPSDPRYLKNLSNLYDLVIRIEKEIKDLVMTTGEGKKGKEELLENFTWIKKDFEKYIAYAKSESKVTDARASKSSPKIKIKLKKK